MVIMFASDLQDWVFDSSLQPVLWGFPPQSKDKQIGISKLFKCVKGYVIVCHPVCLCALGEYIYLLSNYTTPFNTIFLMSCVLCCIVWNVYVVNCVKCIMV